VLERLLSYGRSSSWPLILELALPRLIPPVLPAGTLREHPQPTLTTDRGLVLRPWRPDDETALVAAYEDAAIRYWHHRTLTTDEAIDWIAATARRWRDETDAEWATVRGDEVVGRVALRDVDLAVGQGEVSYWTCPQARGQGVASDSVERVASWALGSVGFWRLEIRHSVDNPASCRVARRAGFTHEAVLARQHIHEDGWHDVHVHSRWRLEAAT
jgi:ribosomal-protein-alanine N-acetyltransferase